MKIIKHKLFLDDQTPANFVPTKNVGGTIKPVYLIMHYTAGLTAAGAIHWFVDPNASASAHLVIDRDGAITQLVPFNQKAWHAGKSQWQNLIGLNSYSIGIEMVNGGLLTQQGQKWVTWSGQAVKAGEVMLATHKNETVERGWHTYTTAQIEAAAEVGVLLVKEYGLRDVLGHEDIAPGRKADPGPAFPMNSFRGRVMGRATDESTLEKFHTTTELNIRSGPGTEYETIISKPLPPDTEVELLEKQGSWWLVDVNGTIHGVNDLQGWVHSRYLA
ncbi:MAG: N-acetylmuramoyl-L-alanine amidase [Myxococcales bacterium]|nr:N-acetylmuramoyl-L-alanine amidase [Myxococcales bacterium]